jgi:MYXO-CTERM domain-containing protein
MKVLRISGVVVGLLLIAAAFVTAFYIEPTYVARVPSDTDAQRTYAGTFRTLLDAQALAKNDVANAVKHNVPLVVDRRVKVQKTSGNTALISDARTINAAAVPVERTTWQYALNRKTLEPVSSPPSGWNVVAAKGLTVSFPLGADKKTYTGWVPETATTVPVRYATSSKRSGLTTYVYRAALAPTPIADPQILAGLPKAVPAALLKSLAGGGSLPPAEQKQFGALLPTLGDPVPLSYTIQGADTFWVEPETGVVIDLARTQQRMAGVKGPNGVFIGLLPVSDATYRQTPAAVNDATHDANTGRDAIQLWGTTVPIIAGIVGALMVAAALLIRRRRPRAA